MVGKKKKHWKTSRREISSPESETVRKGSKSGAPDEIGRYHMYGVTLTFNLPEQMLQMALLLLKNNNCAKLF